MAEIFGKYQLEVRLAFGGMAEIFLAHSLGVDGFRKNLVIKRILPQYCRDPQFVRMFIDEAVLVAQLRHPHIVDVYEFGDVDGIFYMAMEYVDGVDLQRILQSGQRLTIADIACFGEAVSRGLYYAHTLCDSAGKPLGMIHRDISPHNLMFSEVGHVKIMDFGIAKVAARVGHTLTGQLKGKLAYMSPEQAMGEEIDQRSDQYSLGVVLWECVTGFRAFSANSEVQLLRLVSQPALALLQNVRPDTPRDFAEIITRSLNPEPSKRYADLREMAQAIELFRLQLGYDGRADLRQYVVRYNQKTSASAGNALNNKSGSTSPSARRISRQNKSRLMWGCAFVGGMSAAIMGMQTSTEAPMAVLKESPSESAIHVIAAAPQTTPIQPVKHASPAAPATGWLSLRTMGGWCEVYWGNKLLGSTPLMRQKMPVGKVTLHLRNRELHFEKDVELNVSAGKELRYTVTVAAEHEGIAHND